LKFLYVGDIQIDWLRGRMLLGLCGCAEHEQSED
jgi:hypothetical protein